MPIVISDSILIIICLRLFLTTAKKSRCPTPKHFWLYYTIFTVFLEAELNCLWSFPTGVSGDSVYLVHCSFLQAFNISGAQNLFAGGLTDGIRKFQACIHLMVSSFSSFKSPNSVRPGFDIIKHFGIKNKLTHLVVGKLSDQPALKGTFNTPINSNTNQKTLAFFYFQRKS